MHFISHSRTQWNQTSHSLLHYNDTHCWCRCTCTVPVIVSLSFPLEVIVKFHFHPWVFCHGSTVTLTLNQLLNQWEGKALTSFFLSHSVLSSRSQRTTLTLCPRNSEMNCSSSRDSLNSVYLLFAAFKCICFAPFMVIFPRFQSLHINPYIP